MAAVYPACPENARRTNDVRVLLHVSAWCVGPQRAAADVAVVPGQRAHVLLHAAGGRRAAGAHAERGGGGRGQERNVERGLLLPAGPDGGRRAAVRRGEQQLLGRFLAAICNVLGKEGKPAGWRE